jgi:hypothetical protein
MKTILDLVKANVELTSLSGKLEAATEANKNLQAEIESGAASHAEEIAKLGAQHAEDIEALESKIKLLEEANLLLEEQKMSAADKAVEIAASVGVEAPVEEATDEPAPEANMDTLWHQYNAIEDRQERRAFYLKNIKERL